MQLTFVLQMLRAYLSYDMEGRRTEKQLKTFITFNDSLLTFSLGIERVC